MIVFAKKIVGMLWLCITFFTVSSQTPLSLRKFGDKVASIHSTRSKTNESPVPIFYGPNESHSNDWAQCSGNGLVGISYFNKLNNCLIYKTIEPNGAENEQIVTYGTNLEISVLLFDSESNPHIFVATSSTIDQVITHYSKNLNDEWDDEVIFHFQNDGGKFIYELSADLGPDDSFHLLVLKTRSNPDSDDFYYAFLNSYLFYLTNASGSWHKDLVYNYNTILTCDDYVKALNRQDIKVDKQGNAHVVFGIIPTDNFFPSHLCYANNTTGYWVVETALKCSEGSSDDMGWFPSICINNNGIPCISCTYIHRVSSGSATLAKLQFLTRLSFGEWSVETVATNDDGYFGRDGRGYTGGLTHLVFDKDSNPHIVFTDIASSHSGLQSWNLGNIRYATKKDGVWNLSTIYHQDQPFSYYNATEMYGLCLLISDDRIQVVGQQLKVTSSTNSTFELIHKVIETTTGAVTHIPNEFDLQNYPNPFNSLTSIRFILKSTSEVKLIVYGSAGNIVATLLNTVLPSGQHSVTFNSKGLASGVYFYKLVTPDYEQIAKMILIK